jgi:hypothetical protein
MPGGPRELFDYEKRRAVVARWPAARITLRQGARVVPKSGSSNERSDGALRAGPLTGGNFAHL